MNLNTKYSLKRSVNTILLSLLILTSHQAHSEKIIHIAIDDTRVIKDTKNAVCPWGFCKSKAKKLDPHYLKNKIYSELNKITKFEIKQSEASDIKDGLVIKISSYDAGSPGRGYGEAAKEILTLGMAPVKHAYNFLGDFNIYQDGQYIFGNKDGKHIIDNKPYYYQVGNSLINTKSNFSAKRDESVFGKTQKYKDSVAIDIAKYVNNLLITIYSNQQFWEEYNGLKFMSEPESSTSRIGNKLNILTETKNPRICMISCMNNKKCKSWSFFWNPNKSTTCQLNDDTPIAKDEKNYVSGVRLYKTIEEKK
ncbi:MAG: PAN domain-containing protein [Gammaproteobacteria bacterium]|nr:PAN domain-containing protein [Gammaproteobacteria bacterium]